MIGSPWPRPLQGTLRAEASLHMWRRSESDSESPGPGPARNVLPCGPWILHTPKEQAHLRLGQPTGSLSCVAAAPGPPRLRTLGDSEDFARPGRQVHSSLSLLRMGICGHRTCELFFAQLPRRVVLSAYARRVRLRDSSLLLSPATCILQCVRLHDGERGFTEQPRARNHSFYRSCCSQSTRRKQAMKFSVAGVCNGPDLLTRRVSSI
jgi:hypothetical protein